VGKRLSDIQCGMGREKVQEVIVEIWKPIKGWEGFYEVSSLGRVRSIDRVYPALTGTGILKPKLFKGKELKLRRFKDKYCTVNLSVKGINKKECNVHRLVAEAFIGACPEGLEVCHNNGVNTDNRAENLRYDTRLANMREAVASRELKRLNSSKVSLSGFRS
jgi:hypothetical protein